METHLTYDNKGKQLGILVKERFTTDQNLQLKVRPSPRCTQSCCTASCYRQQSHCLTFELHNWALAVRRQESLQTHTLLGLRDDVRLRREFSGSHVLFCQWVHVPSLVLKGSSPTSRHMLQPKPACLLCCCCSPST